MDPNPVALARELADRSPAERETYYAENHVEPALRAEVESLLRNETQAVPVFATGSLLEQRRLGVFEIDGLLGRVLSALRVKRLVVGHTVQKSGINAACNERVYRIDIGLSRYYGTKPAEVLEIQGDAVKVLREKSVEPARAAAAQAVSAP